MSNRAGEEILKVLSALSRPHLGRLHEVGWQVDRCAHTYILASSRFAKRFCRRRPYRGYALRCHGFFPEGVLADMAKKAVADDWLTVSLPLTACAQERERR